MARARAFHSRRHTRKEQSAWKYKVGRHAAGCMLLTAAAAAPAQLCQGGRLQGVVRDPAGAVLSDATVQPQGGKAERTDAHGQFAIDCVHGGNPELTISAEGFETEHVRYKAADRELVVVLPVARVYTTVGRSGWRCASRSRWQRPDTKRGRRAAHGRRPRRL